MSDTDDTDDLLLIPPDFFLINSDTERKHLYEPYYNVVDSLITQVNKLESRINSIEATPNTSYLSSSGDYPVDGNNYQTNLMLSGRRFDSWEHIPHAQDLLAGSTQSTPQKPRARIKSSSLPSTPSMVRCVSDSSPTEQRTYKAYQPRVKLSFPTSPSKRQHSYRNEISNSDNKQEQKSQNKMLSEIDSFISNVNTIKQHQVSKNLNSEFDSVKLASEKDTGTANEESNETEINENIVDSLMYEMESQQREIESRLKEKEHELNMIRKYPGAREEFYKEKVWRQGDTKASVPDRGMGMRNILYDDQYYNLTNAKEPVREDMITKTTTTNLNSQEVASLSDLSARNPASVYSDNSRSLSSSDITQLTAYQNKNLNAGTTDNASSESDKIHLNAMQILHKHKNLLSRNSPSNPAFECDQQSWSKTSQKPDRPSTSSYKNELFGRNQLALMSLSELWNQNSVIDSNKDQSKCYNKLQEEKLRRQHCEQLILELQSRNLELQERMSVAVQIDQAKDDAILTLQKSWEEAALAIDNLSKDKIQFQQQIEEIKTKTSFELSEAAKKVSHYENEASKALNLAHSNQEKMASLEKQNSYFDTELKSLQRNLKTLKESYTTELERNQQLAKIITQKEIELNENKNILSEARKEVGQSKRAVELCQAELISIKQSQTHLETQFAGELEHAKKLELEKSQLLNEIETYKKIQKSLQDDLNKQKQLSEHNKIELRNFYQDQVEAVVRDKLREFQAQLEKAENSIQDEIRSRELSVAKAAAMHIQQITEKHALEVHLLEEKHKEEVKLYTLQISQAQQQIDNLHLKMQQQQERRSNIAQQLHKVMEAQWLEAIKIINNGKSPIISQDKGTNTIDQLNSLKCKSYNNLEEILLKEEAASASSKAGGDFRIQKVNHSLTSTVDDESYEKTAQSSTETPVTSRLQKSRQQKENELQKYVQMLLNRSPGNPVIEQTSKLEKHKNPDNQHDNHNINLPFQQPENYSDMLNPDGSKSSKGNYRDRLGKPPWK